MHNAHTISLPPEFSQLRDELTYGLSSLFEGLGLNAVEEDEVRMQVLADLADAVFIEAIAALAASDPARAERFFPEAEAAITAGDEMRFLRAISEHFPQFPEVFAQTALEVARRTAALFKEHMLEELEAHGEEASASEETTSAA